MKRIINVPKRGIGDSTVNKAFEIATGLGVSVFEVMSHADEYEALKRSSSKLMAFCRMINDLSEKADTMHLDELFNEILEAIDYRAYLEADKEKVTYIKMTPEKAAEVIEKHLKGGKVINEYTISNAIS